MGVRAALEVRPRWRQVGQGKSLEAGKISVFRKQVGNRQLVWECRGRGLGWGAEGRVSSILVWPPYSLHLLEAGAGEAGLWRGWAVKGPAGWSGAGPKASAGESNPCAARGTCFTSLCLRGLYHSGSFRKTKTALGVSTRGSVGELANMSVRDGRSEASNRSCRGRQAS